MQTHPFSLLADPPSSETSPTRVIPPMEQKRVYTQDKDDRRAASISTLPDDVLLKMFDFYRADLNHLFLPRAVWEWHVLVHVCQRWRRIVFASPRHLNLQILCRYGTPVRKNLHIWPALPIILDLYSSSSSHLTPNDEDNIVAALEHHDRVCGVRLMGISSQLGKMVTLMQEPLPVLTCLDIASIHENAPVISAEFLGGSAPCLQDITIFGVPFPVLPTLLLSAGDLVELKLRQIPPTGYISPEAMLIGLAALPKLKTLIIEFQWANSQPDQTSPPLITRVVLPALTSFTFWGASEYLEDLVAHIDSPQLDRIHIHYLTQHVDVPVASAQLSKFVDRSVGPKSTLFRFARVSLLNDHVAFNLYCGANYVDRNQHPGWITISSDVTLQHVSHMAQVLSQFSAILTSVVCLELESLINEGLQLIWLGRTGDIGWLRLFHQFPVIQALHVSFELAWFVAVVLEGITGDMVAEVLPNIELTCFQDLSTLITGQIKFVAQAVRRPSGRPITVVDSKAEFDQRLQSHISI